MGAWGTGLYQSDISVDLKEIYIGKLKSGKSDEVALEEILSENEMVRNDDDDKYDFYFALAETMWKKGRLTEEIKKTALELIEEEKKSDRWETEKLKKAREKVLTKLKEKLESEMPARKKIPVRKPYVLGWEAGDVYTFQIQKELEGYEEYVGWYALMYIDRVYQEDWYVRTVMDELADAYFFLMKEKPEDAEAIKRAKRICFLRGKLNRYRVVVCEVSRKERPKDLTFLGKVESFEYPENETPLAGTFSWGGVHERNILWGYKKQLKYEEEMKQS